MTDTRSIDCIAVNLAALERRLRSSLQHICSARAALTEGKQNLAIGTILPLEQMLPEANALLATILLLHRAEPVTSDMEVMS